MRNPLGVLVLLAAALLLFSALPAPVARATIVSCSGSGCGFFWQTSVWNERYVGGTVRVDFDIYNVYAGTPTDTITSVQLVTPWQTYSDNTLPQSVCYGCAYHYEVNVTIPSTQSVGDVTFTWNFQGTTSTGGAMCYNYPNNICTSPLGLSLDVDPDTLQAQITSLQSTITSLDANVTSLKSQISTLQSQSASLQAQLSTAKGNITTLQTSLATTNAQLTTAKANLNTAQTQLATAQTQLAATRASLASTQSSLSTVSNLYLPLGVAVPSAIALLFLFMYLRKKPLPAPP